MRNRAPATGSGRLTFKTGIEIMAGATPRGKHTTGRSPVPKRRHIPRVLLLIDTAGAVGRQFVRGIGRYAREYGPWSIQFEYRALDSAPPEWVVNWRGDGIIARSTDARMANLLRETGLPVVELLGDPKMVDAEHDNLSEARMVVRHFLDTGLRHFAHFSYGEAWWATNSRDSYCQIVEEHGYTCHNYQSPSIPTRGTFVAHELEQTGLIKWLRSLPRPIGIFTISDLQAVQLLNVCHEQGISVPEEVAILGRGNDVFVCETVRPMLSSVDLNTCEHGYDAAKLLDARMAGRHPKTPIPFPPGHVVVRQSTDSVAISDSDVVQALRFIRTCACTGIKVAQVADEVGMSRRLLERRFLQHLGRTPKDEITRVQIEHAQALLRETGSTCDQVAARSGFSSARHLIRVFRRVAGMTPLAYRKKQLISRDPEDGISVTPLNRAR
jgi:LacI family transcriptional regulator